MSLYTTFIGHVSNTKIMSNVNTVTLSMFFAAFAALLGAAMIANPILQVNAQGNGTNATGVTGVLTITKVNVDDLMKALKSNYPKLSDLKGEEDKSLIGTLKDLKDAKETAKTIVAANLLRDLIQFKALQDLE